MDLDNLCPEVRGEYERWMRVLGPEDPYDTPTTLGIHSVLRAHFLIADFFYAEGEGIGGIGPRDVNMLHSALYRQFAGLGPTRKWNDKFDICATLLFGLIMDHPFHDANKRTAFLSALYYLYKNGRTPIVSHEEFEDFAVDIAGHKLSKFDRYKQLKKDGVDDPEVRFISHYLRSKTRELDKRFYSVTYRDLKRILNGFHCDIDNPKGNHIDILKLVRYKRTLFRGPREEWVRVGQIGFPGWTSQVRVGAIGTVRKVTNLTHEYGIDSQVFYNGVDDLQKLIAYYEEPLRRLAYR